MASAGSTKIAFELKQEGAAYTNKRIFDKITPFLGLISSWGCDKQENETFEQFLLRKGTTKPLKKIFNKDELQKIQQATFTGLDVTFLCKLLPLMCDGIEESGTKDFETKVKDESTIECQLRKIKNLRNNVMHEPEGAAVDTSFLSDVELIASKLLDNAGVTFSKQADEVKKAREQLEGLVVEIRNTVRDIMTEDEKVNHFREAMLKTGIRELREQRQTFQGNSPHLQHIKSFYHLQLSVPNAEEGATISCKEILKFCTDKGDRILFIEGQSGAGKSFLLNKIEEDFLLDEGKTRNFEGSEAFQIPLLFACRTRTSTTVADLTRLTFRRSLASLKEDTLVEKVLEQVKPIILIDGLDEVNERSKDMLERVREFLKIHKDAFCIFTSRSHAAKKFQTEMKDEGFSYQTLMMKELSNEEQLQFICSSCEKGSEISEAYEESELDLKSPVFLALYIFFYHSDAEAVRCWRSPAQIMRATVEYGIKNAKSRLHGRNIQNSDRIINKILESICYISFSGLLKDKVDLEVNEVNWLKDEIEKRCGYFNVDPNEILSCIFPLNSSAITLGGIQFYHKSEQEFLAAIFVAQKIAETGKGIKQIIPDAISKYEEIIESKASTGAEFDIKEFLKK